MPDITTPSGVKDILKQYDINVNRALGQNFLVDSNILEKVIDAACLESGDKVVEIGPGLGALTSALADALPQGRIIAVEKDSRLCQVLQDLFQDEVNVEIICQDALEIDWSEELTSRTFEEEGYRVVANLPYYITSPIIRLFLELSPAPESLVFMVQKEVGERIAADPGSKDYGTLSIAVQYYAEPELIYQVPPTVFWPRPEVESVILRLKPGENRKNRADNEELFFQIVRALFQQRRKTIRNSLSRAAEIDLSRELVDRALERSGIDSRIRGEKLSWQEIVKLSNIFNVLLAEVGD